MQTRSIAVTLLLCLAVGCGGPSPAPDTSGSPSSSTTPPEKIVAVDIGDVEQEVWVAALIASQSKSNSVTENPLRDARGKTNLLNVEVKPPYPEQLWIEVNVQPRRTFPDTPVVLRGSYKIEATYAEGDPVTIEEPLFQAVIGAEFQRRISGGTVNVLEKLTETPSTLLFTVTTQALLMPEGTDAESLDPATATTTVERAAQLLSNPVRIDFVDEGQ